MNQVRLDCLENAKVAATINHNQTLTASITPRYWDFSNRKNTPFGVAIFFVSEDPGLHPSKQASLLGRQAIMVVVFDQGSGCNSGKLLWHKVTGCSAFRVLYDESTRQQVWHLFMDGEEPI
jgi:hypothetical protein